MLGLKYFVLKPEGTDMFAKASREAMLTYAKYIQKVDPVFTQEIRIWANEEEFICGFDRTLDCFKGEEMNNTSFLNEIQNELEKLRYCWAMRADAIEEVYGDTPTSRVYRQCIGELYVNVHTKMNDKIESKENND